MVAYPIACKSLIVGFTEAMVECEIYIQHFYTQPLRLKHSFTRNGCVGWVFFIYPILPIVGWSGAHIGHIR